MDFQLELDILSEKLGVIERENEGILDKAFRSITHCRNVLCTFKKEIFLNGFTSLEQEIKFFKTTKQTPLIPLIYYSEIRSFELQFPKANKNSQLKFINRKINKLNRFFLYHLDFGQYVDSGASHFDKQYYTRDYLDEFHIPTSKFYFQDPDFCSPRDMLLGKFKAYKSLMIYLEQRMLKQKQEAAIRSTPAPNEKLIWPFTNTDWVELVYALHSAGIANQNKLSISKVSKTMQEIFDFTPKEIYKTFQEIKNRKNSRTLFLDQLANSLLSEIDKSEE